MTREQLEAQAVRLWCRVFAEEYHRRREAEYGPASSNASAAESADLAVASFRERWTTK